MLPLFAWWFVLLLRGVAHNGIRLAAATHDGHTVHTVQYFFPSKGLFLRCRAHIQAQLTDACIFLSVGSQHEAEKKGYHYTGYRSM